MDLNKILRLAGAPESSSNTTKKDEKIDEATSVPRTKMELAPKTRKNMEARVKLVSSAIKHLQQALSALEKIPSVDFMGDIPHFHHEIQQILSADDGQAGLQNMVAIFKKELNQTVRKENKIAREEEEAARYKEEEEAAAARYMEDEMEFDEDVQESMNYYSDTNTLSHAEQEEPVNTVTDKQKANVWAKGEKADEKAEPQKIKIPGSVKTELKSASDEFRSKAKRIITRDKAQSNFYNDVADAMDNVVELLTGDINDFKDAQTFFQSLMSPIATNFPASVVKVLAYGGQARSLKDLFKEVKK